MNVLMDGELIGKVICGFFVQIEINVYEYTKKI